MLGEFVSLIYKSLPDDLKNLSPYKPEADISENSSQLKIEDLTLLSNLFEEDRLQSADHKELEDLKQLVILLILLTCKDEISPDVNHLIMQRLIPNFSLYFPKLDSLRKQWNEWISYFWEFSLKLSTSGHSLKAKAGSYFFLARIISLYFPWIDQDTPDITLFKEIGFDLRRQTHIESYLLKGLETVDSSDYSVGLIKSLQRQTLYIAKQIVKFGHCLTNLEDSDMEVGGTNKFIWSSKDKPHWIQCWQSFFELFEVLAEPQLHLIEPHLSKLESCFFTSSSDRVCLGLEWWACILRRGFLNNSIIVRKRILECVLCSSEAAISVIAAECPEFVFGALLEMLDNGFLYSTMDNERLVSPFGEALGQFYSRVLSVSFQRGDLLKLLLEEINHLTNNLAIIYLLNGIAKLNREELLGDGGLNELKSISSHKSFHNQEARKLLRSILIKLILKFTKKDDITFDALTSCIYFCSLELTLVLENELFDSIKGFLVESFGFQQLEDKIVLKIEKLLRGENFKEEPAMCIALLMSLMLSHVSSGLTTKIASSNFANVCRPMFEAIQIQCSNNQFVNLFNLYQVSYLFKEVNLAVSRVTNGKTNLLEQIQLDSLLFEWIELIGKSFCLSYPCEKYIPSTTGVPEEQILRGTLSDGEIADKACLNHIAVLLDTLDLLGDSIVASDMLIQMCDIYLLRSIEWLEFHLQSNDSTFGKYWLQLHKLVVAGTIAFAIKTLNRLVRRERDLIERKHIDLLLQLKPLRTIDHLDPGQLDQWGFLGNEISAKVWMAMGHVASSNWDIISKNEILSLALSNLQDSKGSAVLSILNCFKMTVQSSKGIEELDLELIEESIGIIKKILIEAESASWAFLYAKAAFCYLLNPLLLSVSQLCQDPIDGDLQNFLRWIVFDGLGEKRRGIVPLLAKMLCEWFASPAGLASIKWWEDIVTALVKWGPLRAAPEEKLSNVLRLDTK